MLSNNLNIEVAEQWHQCTAVKTRTFLSIELYLNKPNLQLSPLRQQNTCVPWINCYNIVGDYLKVTQGL